MVRVTILQPSYIPWIGYFDQINKSDVFIFFDDVLYTKNDWRNRNRIKTPQGSCWLTIPVDIKNRISQKLLVKDALMMDSEDTIIHHLKVISANYKRARFYDEVFPMLEEAFISDTNRLSDFTIKSTQKLAEYMGIENVKFYKSSELSIKRFENPTDHLIKICSLFNATHYLTGDSAKLYLQEDRFEKNNIVLEYHNYKHPLYNQLWGDFIPFLSIVDLLCNEGKKSLDILST